MNIEKDQERHQKILEQIANAKTLKELPNVTIATLTKYLAGKKYFDGKKISPDKFMPVVVARLAYGVFLEEKVQDAFVQVLEQNYPGHTKEEYHEKFELVMRECKVEKIMFEIERRNEKIYEIKKNEFFKQDSEIQHQIGCATSEKELPKISRAKIANYILSILKEEKLDKFTREDAKKIVDLYIEATDDEHLVIEKDEEYISLELYKICRDRYGFRCSEVYDSLSAKLASDYKIDPYIEEVKFKERRIHEIYKEEHELIMCQIDDATRISELPQNLSLSRITGYFSGNTIIYPKAEAIPGNEFTEIANMLLEGYLMEDISIQEQLKDIALRYYPEKADEAYKLLHDKLVNLPKTYYYVKEVKYCKSRQEEFIARGGSNVFTYMVPNPKSPIDAGKFYNIYISRTKNLNLEEILPLDLAKIVPKGLGIDSIEWYVRKYFDRTFKLAGGVIVNRDEEIGDVKVFKPSDGKIGVTVEEKTKLDELKDLSDKLKSLIKAKKDETEKFAKMQEEFLASQQQLNDQFNLIEEKIKKLGANEE